MALPPGAVRYLLIGQAIIPFFINVIVNIVIGVLSFGGQKSVATWAFDKGAVADTIGTCFFLPFITCLIATPIVHRQLVTGVASRIPLTDMPRWVRWMNGPMMLRSTKFGVTGLLLLTGPVYGLYYLFAGDSIETFRFIALKAILSGLMGVIVTPLIAFVAMCDHAPSPQRR